MPRPLNVAIVGAGLMGRWHAHASLRAGGRIAAVVDVDEEAARRLAAALGASPTTALTGPLDGQRFDAIHVCTPLETHVGEVRRGLAHRCAIIVEKPLAPTAAATEQLVYEARNAGAWLQPVHQTLFQDGLTRALRWMEHDVLRAIDYVACSAGAAHAPAREDEIVADVLPHALSLIDVILPESLERTSWQTWRLAPGELLTAGAPGTTAVRILVSMHARPTRHELTLYGDRSTVVVDLFHGFAWRSRGHLSRVGKIVRPFAAAVLSTSAAAANLGRRAFQHEVAYPGLRTLISRVYAAGGDASRAPMSDQHILAVARTRDRIVEQFLHG